MPAFVPVKLNGGTCIDQQVVKAACSLGIDYHIVRSAGDEDSFSREVRHLLFHKWHHWSKKDGSREYLRSQEEHASCDVGSV